MRRSVTPQRSSTPSELLGNNPVGDFERARAEMISTFATPGVIDRTGPSLGIAFCDQLLRGWDLATATNQDRTMPDGLPAAAYQMIHGRFTDDKRKGLFKPKLRLDHDASDQDGASWEWNHTTLLRTRKPDREAVRLARAAQDVVLVIRDAPDPALADAMWRQVTSSRSSTSH
jgi:hypothetical protein